MCVHIRYPFVIYSTCLYARATLFHGRPQAGVVTLSEHCLADGRRSVHAAMLSETPETPHRNAESMFR